MLVITRRQLESLELHLEDGRTVTIKPVRIAGDRVRIGIEAPRTILITRDGMAPEARRQEAAV